LIFKQDISIIRLTEQSNLFLHLLITQ